MNTAERDALRGLPWLSRLLYTESIRPRMDYKSGYVGKKQGAGICWNACTEDLEVEGYPGVKYQRPSVQKVRRAAKHLERRGLIENRTKKDSKKLVFFCVLATTDKSAQKKADSKPTEQKDPIQTDETPDIPTVSENSDQQTQHTKKRKSRHTSVVRLFDCMNTTRARARDDPSDAEIGEHLSPQEQKDSANDYLTFCHTHNCKPTEQGFRNLLKTRVFFKQQRWKTRSKREELYDARRSKLSALSFREQQIADNIHDENIFRMKRGALF